VAAIFSLIDSSSVYRRGSLPQIDGRFLVFCILAAEGVISPRSTLILNTYNRLVVIALKGIVKFRLLAVLTLLTRQID
jgi:hypothetical protein